MNSRQIMRGLMIASFSALALSAGAQTQTQGDNPRGNSTPGNTPMTPQTSGAPSGTGSANGTGTINGGTTYDSTMNKGNMNGATMNNGSGNAMTNGMTKDNSGTKLYNDYRAARKACDGMAPTQRAQCTDAANKKFSAIDAKCQKLDGLSLQECLNGADHGS